MRTLFQPALSLFCGLGRHALNALGLIILLAHFAHAENVVISAAALDVAKNSTTPVAFTISRDVTTTAETFSFTVSGTAVPGTNYSIYPGFVTGHTGTITLAAGAATAPILVTPINDGVYDGPLQVIITLSPLGGDTLVGNGADSLTFTETQPLLSLVANTPPASLLPLRAGTFTVSFPGPPQTTSTQVDYIVTGNAVPGIDYSALSGTVSIPASATSATITITPLANTLIETATIITLTLVAQPVYGINGSFGTASMGIANTNCGPIGVGTLDANGTYPNGFAIQLTVTFNTAVNVTGTPTLSLDTGTLNGPGIATYSSGTGTPTLVFLYVVRALDNAPLLECTSTTALSLNGGAIISAVSAVAALLTLPTPGGNDSLSASAQLDLNGVSGTIKPVPGTIPTGDTGSPRCGGGAVFASLVSGVLVSALFLRRRRSSWE